LGKSNGQLTALALRAESVVHQITHVLGVLSSTVAKYTSSLIYNAAWCALHRESHHNNTKAIHGCAALVHFPATVGIALHHFTDGMKLAVDAFIQFACASKKDPP
jgi:hypothetical protein